MMDQLHAQAIAEGGRLRNVIVAALVLLDEAAKLREVGDIEARDHEDQARRLLRAAIGGARRGGKTDREAAFSTPAKAHPTDALCATCGKVWGAHFGACCDDEPGEEDRRFVLAMPSGVRAHSKSEYKRRVAQGDSNVLPPTDGVPPTGKVQLPEKARAGIEVLHRVVESLLTTSRYVDEEGEATQALADLSDCIADPPFRLRGTDGVGGRDAA